MSLKIKLSVLKQKADDYDALNQNYVDLQEKYNDLLEKVIAPSSSMVDIQNQCQLLQQQNQEQQQRLYYLQYHYNIIYQSANNLKYNEIQLKIELDNKQNQINEIQNKLTIKDNELEYYKKFLITTNEYNSLVSGLYQKEQINNTKFHNLMNELKELQEENEILQKQNEELENKNSDLIGVIDDLKCNNQILEKNKLNIQLNDEINLLENLLEYKDTQISNYINEIDRTNVILGKYKIKNIILTNEINELKKIVNDSDEEEYENDFIDFECLDESDDDFYIIANYEEEKEEDTDDDDDDDEEYNILNDVD
jgi:chromosome segregation ATPase